MLWVLPWCFCETPCHGSKCMSESFYMLLRLYPSYWFALSSLDTRDLSCLVLSCFILFGHFLLEACYFLNRIQRGNASGGEGDGNSEEE